MATSTAPKKRAKASRRSRKAQEKALLAMNDKELGEKIDETLAHLGSIIGKPR